MGLQRRLDRQSASSAWRGVIWRVCPEALTLPAEVPLRRAISKSEGAVWGDRAGRKIAALCPEPNWLTVASQEIWRARACVLIHREIQLKR